MTSASTWPSLPWRAIRRRHDLPADRGAAAANHNERLKGARDTLAGADTGTPPGAALAGENGWTEISSCPLITNDDGNVAVQGMTDILAANPDLTVFLSTGAFTQWYDNAYRQAVEPYAGRLADGSLTIVVADTLPMQMEQLAEGLANAMSVNGPSRWATCPCIS